MNTFARRLLDVCSIV